MLEKLKQLICPAIRIPVATLEGKLIVKEDAPESDISKLTIDGIPTDCLAFTLDYQPKKNRACFQQLSCYLNRSKGNINKGCDCVIVTEIDDTWSILLLELKSKKPKLSDTEMQLKNSEVFIRYLVDLLNTHYEVSPNCVYQRVAVTTKDRAHVRKGLATKGKMTKGKPKKGKTKVKKVEYQPPYFETIPLSVKNREAKVHLDKLLRPHKL